MATLTLYNCTNMTLTGMIDYIASNEVHDNLVLDVSVTPKSTDGTKQTPPDKQK